MSLRIICREVDDGAAANIGGPVHTTMKTFLIEAPEVEAYLAFVQNYSHREVIGVGLVRLGDKDVPPLQ